MDPKNNRYPFESHRNCLRKCLKHTSLVILKGLYIQNLSFPPSLEVLFDAGAPRQETFANFNPHFRYGSQDPCTRIDRIRLTETSGFARVRDNSMYSQGFSFRSRRTEVFEFLWLWNASGASKGDGYDYSIQYGSFHVSCDARNRYVRKQPLWFIVQ